MRRGIESPAQLLQHIYRVALNLRIELMRIFFFTFSLSVIGGVSLVAPTIAHHLHEATVQQCALHDWPKHQAEAHLKFCQEYLASDN